MCAPHPSSDTFVVSWAWEARLTKLSGVLNRTFLDQKSSSDNIFRNIEDEPVYPTEATIAVRALRIVRKYKDALGT
jgi:hypothetical protein